MRSAVDLNKYTKLSEAPGIHHSDHHSLAFSTFLRVRARSTASSTAVSLLIVCLLVICRAQSQTANFRAVQDPRALQLLIDCSAAMGSPAEDFGVSAAGTIADSDHPSLPARQISIEGYGRRFFRSEEEIDGQKLVLLIGRKQATQTWRGKAMPLSVSESALRTPELVPGFNCKLADFRQAENVTYLGQETRNGILVDHLRLTSAGDRSLQNGLWSKMLELDLYLDAQTHLVSSLRRELFSAAAYQNHSALELRFDDYQPLNGVQIPHRIERLVGNHPLDITTLSNVSAGVSSGQFLQ